jgi:DNA-binding response OmpR family regulator
MKPHILVVDDSLTVRMDLRAVLTAAGFAVTACESKAAAQKALHAKSFALVVIDVMLPDGSGIDLLREIRSEPASVHVPVILLSTEAEVRHRIRGLTTGADEYVGKPYDSAYITKCARELIRAQEAPSSLSGSSSFGGKKILIVDDSPTYLESLAQLLRQDGHDVVLARSGEEALELLAVELVDAVILDLLMPGIGGVETCRRIRKDLAWRHIPVMMLTGRDDEEARREGLLAGVDEFVVKSPELELLRVRLRSLLRKKRLEHMNGGGPAEAPPPATGAARSSRRHADADERAIATLFDRVIGVCGLPYVIGPSTIERACKRAGVDAKTMSPGDLWRALPAIRDTLSLFFPREEAERRVEAIASLARTARTSSP